MMRNFITLLQATVFTVLAIAITNAQFQNPNGKMDFFGEVSVRMYCTLSAFVPGEDNSNCKTNIEIVDKSTGAVTEESTKNNLNAIKNVVPQVVTRVINQAEERLVYVPGPAGRDGKNGTTTVVYETRIAGVSVGPSAYFQGDANQRNQNFQTTVPADIWETFIHIFHFDNANGNNLATVNLLATNTTTVNLTAYNAVTGILSATNTFALATGTIGGVNIYNASITNATATNLFAEYASLTNSTSTNLFSVFARILELVVDNATITNATTTNLVSENASTTNLLVTSATITNSTSTAIFSTYASITEATTTNLFAVWANFLNLFVGTLTFENATGTNLQVANASTTNLTATGTTNLSNAFIASSTQFNSSINSGNATLTTIVVDNATSVNFFSSFASITEATSTNIFASWFKAVNAMIDNLTVINASITNATTTNLVSENATVTKLFADNSTITNAFVNSASITQATTTNLFSAWLNSLNAMFTNLVATRATFTSATTTNLAVNTISNIGTNPITFRTNGAGQDFVFAPNGVEVMRISETGQEVYISPNNDLYVGDDLTARDIFASTTIAGVATITSATTTNFFTNVARILNLWVSALTANIINVATLNATSSVNALVLNASTTNASTTNTLDLFAANATLTNATITNLYSVDGNRNLGTTTMYGSLIPFASTSWMTLGTLANPWAELFVSSSSVYIGSDKISNVDGTLVWGGDKIQATGSTTEVNATNLVASTTNTEALQATTATLTGATSTNLFASMFSALNAKIDGLVATDATITNATTSNLFSALANFTTLVFANLTGTNATITNATTTNFATTNLVATNSTSSKIFSTEANFVIATSTNHYISNLKSVFATSTVLAVQGLFKNTGSTQLGMDNFDSVIVDAGVVINSSTIDSYSGINLKAQGVNSQFFLPEPTASTSKVGQLFLVNNVGTNTLKLAGTQMAAGIENIPAKQSRQLVWTEAGWLVAAGETNITNNNSGTSTAYIALRATTTSSTTGTSNTAYLPLSFPIAAGEKWIIQVNVPFSTSANNVDMGFAITNTGASATCSYGVVSQSESSSSGSCGTQLTTGLDNTNRSSIITGVVTAGGAGTVGLSFARTGSAGSGTVTINSGATLVAYKVTGADLAEVYYAKDISIEEGDVVALDGTGVSQVAKSNKNYQKNTLGIISTKPGLVMGEVDGEGKAVIVGLSGRVPVKVTTKNGNIKAGDFLTASDIPGVAMRATGAGQVIGQALTDYSNSDISTVGKVMVFIKNTYHDGNSDDDTAETIADKFTALVKNSIEKLSGVMLSLNLWVSELKANSIEANRVTVQEFCVGSECFSESDMKEFRNYLNSKKVVNTAPVDTTNTPVDTTTSTETVENIISENPSPTEESVETQTTETANTEVSTEPVPLTETSSETAPTETTTQ